MNRKAIALSLLAASALVLGWSVLRLPRPARFLSTVISRPAQRRDDTSARPESRGAGGTALAAGNVPTATATAERDVPAALALDSLPPGRLRTQVLSLSARGREAVDSALRRSAIPRADAASLQVDPDGSLFYSCRPPSGPRSPESNVQARATAPARRIAAAAVPISSPPIRHSRPGAAKKIYLDFNGHNITNTAWNKASGTEGSPDYEPAVATYVAKAYSSDSDYATFSDVEQAEIIEIWQRIAEDYRPFDVDVTTEEPAFTTNVGRILITDSVDANTVNMPSHEAGGVAYLGKFGAGDYAYYSPALVYADNEYYEPSYIAEAASHEMGHNLGLSHDGGPGDEYYAGHGSGATSWGALMGTAYDANVSQWSKGEYAGATNTEDDLATISGHLGYIPDDYADTNGGAAALGVSGSTLSCSGVISGTLEGDRFSFTAASNTVNFSATPFRSGGYTDGGNLDISLEIRAANDAVIATSPGGNGETMANVTATVTPGSIYYLRVTGAGDGNPYGSPPTGYTSYGSLGSYSVTGSMYSVANVAPTFTQQPANGAVNTGSTAYFTAVASGIPTPNYHWQRLGTGASAWSNLADDASYTHTQESTLVIATTAGMDGDQFRCVASNVAGSTYSSIAQLSVIVPPLPTVSASGSANGSLGMQAQLGASYSDAQSLQWYHDGQPLAGQTWNILYLNGSGPSVFGEYFVVATGPGGKAVSNSVVLQYLDRWLNDGIGLWQDSVEVDGVVYFLFTDSARIERYDLASMSWLAKWTLPGGTTCMAFTADSIYLGVGATVRRYSRAFAGGADLLTTPDPIDAVLPLGDKLIVVSKDYQSVFYDSYRWSDGAHLDRKTITYEQRQEFLMDSATSRLFQRTANRSPGQLKAIEIASNGSFSSELESTDSGAFREPSRIMVLDASSGLLVETNGIAYGASDLAYKGSFGGAVSDVLVNPSGGYFVLRGGLVSTADAKFRETGRALMSIPAMKFVKRDNNLVGFAVPSTPGDRPRQESLSVSLIGVTRPPAVTAGEKKIWSPQIEIGPSDTVFIRSTLDHNFFRWSPGKGEYLSSIPYSGVANTFSVGAGEQIYYAGGTQIRSVRPGLLDEPFYSADSGVVSLQAMGDHVLACDPGYYTRWRNKVIDGSGTLVSGGGSNPIRDAGWSPLRRSFYFFEDNSSYALDRADIATDWSLHGDVEGWLQGQVQAQRPIRISPDGQRVVIGSGQVFDADSLSITTTMANGFSDATWAGGSVHTIRTVGSRAQLQSWNAATFQLTSSVYFSGTPLRLFTLRNGRLLLITSDSGALKYRQFDPVTLAEIQPSQPVAAVTDFNADGAPDILLENATTGQRVLWLMGGPNNAFVTQGLDLGFLDAAWHIVGTADFNGGGAPDILLENSASGQRVLWLMGGPNNAYVLQGLDLGFLDASWHIAGTADFNGDGAPDILLENTSSGQRVLWLMGGPNNAFVLQGLDLGVLDAAWHIAGLADFNTDGAPDILLENTSSGQRVLWLMGGPNNAYVTQGLDLGVLPPVWRIVKTVDFNADGAPDILLENSASGQRVLWLMGGPNNAYVIQGLDLGILPADWHIVK